MTAESLTSVPARRPMRPQAVCEAVLGPDYEILEIGLDVPFQGAKYQPWHRDFPAPRETYEEHRITSLAFNLSGVDVTPDHLLGGHIARCSKHLPIHRQIRLKGQPRDAKVGELDRAGR